MRCVYQVLDHTLTQISPEDDLRWYSIHYGSSMTYTWPEFDVSENKQTDHLAIVDTGIVRVSLCFSESCLIQNNDWYSSH